MCDPAVILIERVHQSFKCNTRSDIEHPFPGCRLTNLSLSFSLPAHFVLTSVKSWPSQRPPIVPFSLSAQPLPPPFILFISFGSCIISYALLNKSARTAITIDTELPLPLSFPFVGSQPPRPTMEWARASHPSHPRARSSVCVRVRGPEQVREI